MRKICHLFSFLIIAAFAINASHIRKPRQRGNCPSLESIQNSQGYRVENYTVHSTVKTRFACTKIYSHITNTDSEAKELCFTITLSEEAFISSLCMEVDGKKYQGIIEEKSLAKQLYDDAIDAKATVALVESVDGKNQKFNVCTNVRAGSTALFTVEYKQLLVMKLRRIEHRIPIELGQNADYVGVSVEYDEPQGLQTIQSSNGVASVSDGGTGLYNYIKSQNSQTQNCNSNPSKELVVSYKPVIRNSVTTYVANYTFLQFFSPTYSLCLDVNLILVVDVSGSMRSWIDMVKEFLREILYQLNDGDNLNIILFNATVTKLSDSLVRFERGTRSRTRNFIDNIRAAGNTNINGALVETGRQILEAYQSDPHRANMLFLISDGRTNVGERDPIIMDRNFRNAKLDTPVILHTFSVGRSDNEQLLNRLTILNGGSLHQIQTEDLFNELLDVAIDKLRRECPLLSNIQFNYPNGSVEELTITSFPYFTKGQELIVSGRVLQGADDVIHMNITGNIRGGRRFTWRRSISLRLASESQNSCLNETMLAYLKVKEMNEEYILTNDDQLRDEITDISKRHHFVTNLTSLLVSEATNEQCACPDECVCNSGCPQGSSSPGTNVAGNQIPNPISPGPPDARPRGVVPPDAGPLFIIPPDAGPRGVVPPDAGPLFIIPPDAGPRGVVPPDAGPLFIIPPDAGPRGVVPPDAGPLFIIPPDAGPQFIIPPDAGPRGVVPPDAGPLFIIPPDAGPRGVVPPDAGPLFIIPPDAGPRGVVPPDAGPLFIIPPDAGPLFIIPPDAGPLGIVPPGAGQPGPDSSVSCRSSGSKGLRGPGGYPWPGHFGPPGPPGPVRGGPSGPPGPVGGGPPGNTGTPACTPAPRKYKRRRALLPFKDCTIEGEDIPSNWLNVSQCVDRLNSNSLQVRCWIAHTEECRDYWIRSIDCNTGEIEHFSSPLQEQGLDQRCSVWYDATEDNIRCSSQLEMLQSLFQLDVSLCPFSDELNREYYQYIANLYEEFELGDQIACSYDYELSSCKLA